MTPPRLSDLLDMTMLQNMADAHYRAAGVPIGIIDAFDGSILVGAGWQDICTKFHRAHPLALARCHDSDNYLKNGLVEAEAHAYKCENGLWDIGIPIVVAGCHLATMFLGQFLYTGEAPDRERFVEQAREFGFDIDEYLEALDKVPVFDRDKVGYILEYNEALVSFIAELAEHALRQRTAEETLLASERKFHAIFDMANQFIGLLTRDGVVLEANQTALRSVGLNGADVIGRPFWECPWWTHTPELQQRVRLGVGEAATGRLVQFEATYRSSNGRLRYFDFSLKPVVDDTGDVTLIIPEGRDITKRKEAEREVKRQADFLQSVIDAAPNPIFYKDVQGRYLGCNRAFEELYAVTRAQIIGKRVDTIESPEGAVRHEEVDAALLSSPGRRVYESSLLTPDGVWREVIIHKATLDGPEGAPAGIVGVMVDITDRKLAEDEKRRLLEQLAQSQKMESVGRLAGGVAHDFNNMLNIILGYSELMLLQLQPDDPLRDQIVEIHAAGERSRDITRQLLAFARKEIIAPKILDLNVSVEDALKILKRLIGENITLAWLPGRERLPVLLDPSQLDQILANLCVNARDAIADVGKVVITTGAATLDAAFCSNHEDLSPGEYAWLAVSDTGSGMHAEMLDKVFEPFFTTKGLGTGLGLSTVYGIVRQNGGGINVASAPGEGTTFTIYLPLREAALLEETPAAAEGPPAGNGETVLVVDDEVAIVELTEHILTNYNYRVIAAKSPSEALHWAESHPGEIDLLVTDMIMPEMNGYDLSQRLKALDPALKCLYMSGYAADVVSGRGLLGKGAQFIQKPWNTRDFVASVKSALTDAGETTSPRPQAWPGEESSPVR